MPWVSLHSLGLHLDYEESKKKEAGFPKTHASIPKKTQSQADVGYKNFKDLNTAAKLSQVKSTNG